MIDLKETQSDLERDEETLHGLGGELIINGINFPPPTTAVLSLLEIIESPFILGFENFEDIKLRHINEALYVLKFREDAVQSLFNMVKFERIANKSPEYFKKYLESVDCGAFSKRAFKFAETLGVFNQLEIVVEIQEYMSVCFNAFDMLPSSEGEKKKDSLTVNG